MRTHATLILPLARPDDLHRVEDLENANTLIVTWSREDYLRATFNAATLRRLGFDVEAARSVAGVRYTTNPILTEPDVDEGWVAPVHIFGEGDCLVYEGILSREQLDTLCFEPPMTFVESTKDQIVFDMWDRRDGSSGDTIFWRGFGEDTTTMVQTPSLDMVELFAFLADYFAPDKPEPNTLFQAGTKVYNHSGIKVGITTGKTRACVMAGCAGTAVGVRWNTNTTWPCSEALFQREDGNWQIK